MTNLISEHIDVWMTAQTPKSSGRGNGTSYGIKKLRELIFDIAGKGLLVKRESVHEKLSKLGETAEIIMGQAPPGKECNKESIGTIFVKTGEFGELYPEIKEWTTKPLKHAKEGDVLICVVGATVGKLNLAIDCAIGRSVASIRPNKDLSTKYLYYSLMPYTLKLRGQSRGSAQGVIGKNELSSVRIRLPSMVEQHRIVAKVDELMALCDQLEQQQNENNRIHLTLVETMLGTLTETENHSELDSAWQHIADNFDTLFTTEESIDLLKKTILQLAVMGKLVPQDPDDEPASVLLEKIAKGKARLIKEGKIKKEKLLLSISEDEKPFVLPETWEWVRLSEIVSKITDGDHQTPPRISEGYRVLSAKNVRDGYLDLDNCDFISKEHYIKSRERCCPEYNDLLIVSVGGTIGRTSLIPRDSYFALVRSVALIKPLLIDSRYLKYSMDSSLLQNSIHVRKRGGAQPCLYLSEIEKFLFSLPPLPEQHRIVAKVDELMTLCDTLKTRLNEAQTTQVQLADAIVAQAVA